MTDKAAREAFATELARVGTDSKFYTITAEQWYIAGYQAAHDAAHDAAMAAEPDVQEIIRRLATLTRSPGEKRTLADDATAVLESLLLQLQAAQQREAECRKDADRYRWLRDTDGPLYIVDGNSALEPDEADAYIDAALATQPTPDSD